MKLDYVKIAMTGLKIAAAVVGGIAIVAGINKITEKAQTSPKKPKPNPAPVIEEEINDPYEYQPSEIDKLGAKVINGIRVTQTIMSGVGSIISCLSVIFNTSKNLFNKDYYNASMINDPNNWSGYHGQQMIPSCPWENRPMLMGVDTRGENIYCVKRSNNVVEVW